jgi:3-hydroxyisobutyrate dehydrogenase-like beta-hydroxyacid dehydrogenase
VEEVIGVIGLGNMGSVIAKSLAEKYKVIGFDVDEKKRVLIGKEGIDCADSLEALAMKINRLVISLPDGNISKKVIGQLVPMMTPHSIVVETSTVLPKDLKYNEEICKEYEVEIVDAAILGGVSHVVNKNAKLLVGGKKQVVEVIREILLTVGDEIIQVGELGSGMGAKVINNAVAHNVMVLISEAAAIGMKLGIKPEMMYELLLNETTYVRPVEHRYKERVLNSSYEGGMSTRNARKDSMLVMELAQEVNVPLFSIQASHTVYDIALQEGLGELDYASIATLWERWSDLSFNSKLSKASV